MEVLITIYLFIFGAIFGSFILAVVDRIKARKDWVRGRSECDYCHRTLQPRDLIPVFSWLSTAGRCRYCNKNVSAFYPLAEIGLGVAFSVSYVYWPYVFSGAADISLFMLWLSALVLMWGLFLYDIRWYILPNKLMYPLFLVSSLWALVQLYLTDGTLFTKSISLVLAVMVSAGFFYALYRVSKGTWIGFGDVRLGVVIGLFTGTWQLAWLTLFIASIVGIIFSIPVITNKKHKGSKLKIRIPFGPMLISALFIVILFGQTFIDWYVAEILLL